MTQLPLRLPPAAAADPASSHAAAAEITRSGVRETQTRRAAEFVAKSPGCTALELADRFGVERHGLSKRLADAEHRGLVRKGPARRCRLSGRTAVTWEAIR